MLTIEQYIEKVKRKKGIKTDAAFANAIGVSPEYLNQVKKGKYTCNDTASINIAKMAGVKGEEVLAVAQYTTANDVIKPAWIRMYKRVRKAVKEGLI